MSRHFNFKVRGEGPFPFNMLEVDTCLPATVEDVERLELLAGRGEQREIHLFGYSVPSPKEWAKYGWTVVDDDEPRVLH